MLPALTALLLLETFPTLIASFTELNNQQQQQQQQYQQLPLEIKSCRSM
jgi:hypothetical protein